MLEADQSVSGSRATNHLFAPEPFCRCNYQDYNHKDIAKHVLMLIYLSFRLKDGEHRALPPCRLIMLVSFLAPSFIVVLIGRFDTTIIRSLRPSWRWRCKVSPENVVLTPALVLRVSLGIPSCRWYLTRPHLSRTSDTAASRRLFPACFINTCQQPLQLKPLLDSPCTSPAYYHHPHHSFKSARGRVR